MNVPFATHRVITCTSYQIWRLYILELLIKCSLLIKKFKISFKIIDSRRLLQSFYKSDMIESERALDFLHYFVFSSNEKKMKEKKNCWSQKLLFVSSHPYLMCPIEFNLDHPMSIKIFRLESPGLFLLTTYSRAKNWFCKYWFVRLDKL